MAMTGNVQEAITIGGKSFGQSFSAAGEGIAVIEKPVPAAKVGTLTTRTDDNTGTLTMAASHGITTGAKLDLYWAGGRRLGLTVGTVATNSVPIDGGAGDVLPTAATAITAMVPISEPMPFVGDNLVLLGYGGANGAQHHVNFLSSVPASLLSVTLDSGRFARWYGGIGVTNPLAGVTVATVEFSHGNSAAAQTMRAGALLL